MGCEWNAAATLQAIACICLLFLSSCGVIYDQATAANRNRETIIWPYLGGTGTVTGANGAHATFDARSSFQAGVSAAGTAYAAAKAASTTISTTASNNATALATTNSNNAASIANTASNNAATAAADATKFKTAVLSTTGKGPPKPAP